MSQTHLTHKYRPQRFADVAGQDVIKSILSRAAATGAVAPAYLFSGTRGVGKTTIARIFAKALNCENGPTAEPCNECAHCRQIQAGAAVDVMEIDGASHTGVENVRSLKEDVGFAPIDCRYKVFIIDEAHMLSKSAFNALLKTLEEPPSHVTFIMATTEPHKFPATIISRCQHYTFQRLAQKELEAHLKFLLESEGLPYEADALALIARRGAGSVRDSMSLMGQVLALGGEKLTSADVRQVLGLAGREIMFNILAAVHGRDCLAITEQLREILDQGLDLGFFLRELTECWRSLFLLGQSGEAALPVLDITEDEAPRWLEWTGKFSPAHVHACWQLTLEGQQRVKASLEPALALELLLLNLAYLPRLMPLDGIAAGEPAPAPPGAAPAPAPAAGQGGGAPSGPSGRGAQAAPAAQPARERAPEPAPEPVSEPVSGPDTDPDPRQDAAPGPEAAPGPDQGPNQDADDAPAPQANGAVEAAPEPAPEADPEPAPEAMALQAAPRADAPDVLATEAPGAADAPAQARPAPRAPAPADPSGPAFPGPEDDGPGAPAPDPDMNFDPDFGPDFGLDYDPGPDPRDAPGPDPRDVSGPDPAPAPGPAPIPAPGPAAAPSKARHVDGRVLREEAMRHPLIESVMREFDARVADVRKVDEDAPAQDQA